MWENIFYRGHYSCYSYQEKRCVYSWVSAVGGFISHAFPELIVGFILLAIRLKSPELSISIWDLGILFVQFLSASCWLRILWNSAIIIHGLGHSLTQVLVEQNPKALTLSGVLEYRSPLAIVQSCLPLQAIFIPFFPNPVLPWLPVGDATPWKVRLKASGGLLFNGAAMVIAGWVYRGGSTPQAGSGLPLDGSWLQAVGIAAMVANGLILGSSGSDLVAILTGQADRFYCGNFGFIAKKTGGEMQGLIPQRWLDLFKVMGRETEVRGEQAGGGLTLAQDWSGRTYFVGDKIVNAKRSNLTHALEAVFHGTRDRAWRSGFRPRQATITGVWHYRFGTSGPPSVLETHWHEWSPAHLQPTWRIEQGQWAINLQNVNHRITHNGDLDGWQLFGQPVDYQTLGLWLERVLQVPNHTVGDSPKIAGLMDLLITQGLWLPSVRLAYQLAVATALDDAFGGCPPTKSAPNTAPDVATLQQWAQCFDTCFALHVQAFPSAAQAITPLALQAFQQTVMQSLENVTSRHTLDPYQRQDFAQTAIQLFLHNDPYRATQVFMKRARGSFGLVTVSTLGPNHIILSSLGQPITIGVDPQQQYSIYASEPSAVDAVLLRQPETYRLDLDQNAGEIAVLGDTSLRIYSLTENRELQEAEVIFRRVPYRQHPYLQGNSPGAIPAQPQPPRDPVGQDLYDIPKILQAVQDSWVDPTSLNRQSAEYLLDLLITKAKYLADKQAKLASLDLDPALAESHHVDILITGVENSLWLGERFAKDLKAIFPLLSIKTLSSNLVLHKLQYDFGSLGLARQSIVFAISQSGQTFPTRQVLHASDLLVRQGVIREFFMLTGEPTSFIGSSLARPVYPGEPFSRRLFTNKSGRRLAEPATVSVAATHQTLTELLFYLTRQMQLAFPGQQPLGMTLSPESLLVLQGMEDEFFLQSVVEILGANSHGQGRPTRLHRYLMQGGQRWAQHITEAPLAWGIHALYILITVGWAIPFGYTIPLAQTLLRGTFILCHIAINSTFSTLLLAVCTLVDIGIYIFGAWLWTLGLRLIQRRQLLARMGKRTLIIGDVPWVQQILKIYVSKLFSLSYGITSLEIHGANPQDHLVHQFGHRVVRGTLLYLGFPDGRCSQKQRNEENAVLTTARQASGIQHMRTGPEIVAVGSNPNLCHHGFVRTMVLSSPTHKACEESDQPPLSNHLIETLRESRFGSFRRLLASYVFFWALAQRVASFPLLQYPFWRSQSRTKIMTTAAPVAANNLDRPEQDEISILELQTVAHREQS